MPSVIEFTLQAKPGHYEQVLEEYIAFADELVASQPAEEMALITGDASTGVIRGIGLFDTHEAAAAPNSLASFAAFMDRVASMIEGAPTRTEMDLVHAYIKA